ncbi:MAG TPA: hypothetical protein VGG86_20935 [Roseiarcus sp.]|jgi:hypothetical protein
MIKTLAAAAVLSLGLSGYALAQSTITGAPAGTAPETAEPPAPMMHHHHHHHHHHYYHHHMHHMAPEGAPAPAPAQ